MCSHAYRLLSIPMCVPHQPVVTLHALYVYVFIMSLVEDDSCNEHTGNALQWINSFQKAECNTSMIIGMEYFWRSRVYTCVCKHAPWLL